MLDFSRLPLVNNAIDRLRSVGHHPDILAFLARCHRLAKNFGTISDPRQVNREGFDLVVDDGSHISEDVLGNFVHCWKWVKPGGFYVIEDMACTYNDGYRDKYNKHFSKCLKNDRELMKTLWDAIAREIDAGVGAYTEMRYYRQMWVFKR